MGSDLKRKLRCAIYTRKSTEEGLEQDFNSLHAQYEACAAYVASQRHEGWELVPTHYDDGGYSGGTLDRPAFQQLLADLEQGRVDVIVVYKVDRLTRSLADFARIVDVLDRRGASFVSVTQAFNTTNSMGRLTLNVLLSFAQFEREVTGERIRDKIAASKAKGMWMGGTVPLGYKVKFRKLVVVETEAELVRTIFRTFLEQGSMRGLIERLRELDLRTKVHVLKTGVRRGGVHFSQGGLSQMLRSRVYRGEVCHGGKVYPGEHRAIVDKDMWEAAQLQLDRAVLEKKMQSRAESPSLLAGLVRDEHNRPLTATHANRHGRRYRYYVTSADKCGNRQAWRISAIGLEELVTQQLRLHHADTTEADVGPIEVEAAQALMASLQSPNQQSVRGAVLQLIRQIEIRHDGILIDLNSGERLSAPAALIRSGKTMKMVIPAPQTGLQCDVKLVHLVARADEIRERIVSGESIPAIAAAEGCSKASVIRLARLGLLPSDVITAVVEGRQPRQLTRSRLWELTAIPLDWAGQRQLLGFS